MKGGEDDDSRVGVFSCVTRLCMLWNLPTPAAVDSWLV